MVILKRIISSLIDWAEEINEYRKKNYIRNLY